MCRNRGYRDYQQRVATGAHTLVGRWTGTLDIVRGVQGAVGAQRMSSNLIQACASSLLVEMTCELKSDNN